MLVGRGEIGFVSCAFVLEHSVKQIIFTPTEQLEYKIALLERELLKKNGEIERLKKSIELQRGDAKRK